MASSSDLDIVNVTKRFGAHFAVNDVTFSVAPGEFFSILGPSGCGKTTLMRMIAGFENPTSGDIRIRDKSMVGVPANRRPVNMVFQSLALFPMMSVGENVAYGMTCRGRSRRAEADDRATRMLERVGLKGFGDRQVTALSGGQRQRVAIARCLVLEPTLVLLDEPLGALDLKLREHMKIELKQLQGTFNTTFAYITHDQSEALVMSDRIAVMNQGRFEQVGSPRELYHNPGTPFVASFVGETNRWQGAVTSGADGAITVRLPSGISVQGQGKAGAGDALCFARPEAIALASDAAALGALANRFEGRVSAVLFDGANSSLLIDTRGFDRACSRRAAAGGCACGDQCGSADPSRLDRRRHEGLRRMKTAQRLTLFLMMAPAILWLGVLIVLPHVEILILSFSQRVAPRVYEFGFGNYLEFFTEPLYWRTFARTAIMSILVTAITLVLAFPIALYIARVAQGRLKAMLLLLCLLPFWVSELVRTLGWMMLLRETGIISYVLRMTGLADQPVELLYNDGAVILGLVYGGLLFMIVPLANALESLDPSVVEAGYDLGGLPLDRHSPHRHPPCDARHRRGVDHRVHADGRQFRHAGPARRQERPVVHRADLRAVHHALQLAPGGGLRHAPPPAFIRHRLGRLAPDRPGSRHHIAAGMIR